MLQMLFVVILATFVFATQGMAQTTLLTESFDGGTGQTPPTGWSTELVSGGNYTYFFASGTYPSVTPYDGTGLVEFNSWDANTGVTNRLKRTTALSTVGYTNVAIDFAWYEDNIYTNNDRVEVQWSTDGSTWNTEATFARYNSVTGWKIKNVALPSGAQGQATLYIAFNFISAYGNNCHLDLAHVTGVAPPAPTSVTIGTGTSTVGHPYYTFYMDSRTQMLYTSSEIQAAGGSPGEITTIGFYVSSYSSQTMNGFNFRLQNTSLTSLSSWITDGFTTCFSGTYTVPGTGWQLITLQTPFIWDGSNLLLEVCFDNSSYTSNTYVRYTSNSGKTLHYHTDGSSGCSMTSINTSSSRPNLQFVVTPWVGTLTGTVTDSYYHTPINGATIAVPGTAGATTNASGGYTIYNVPFGQKTVTCSAANHVTEAKTVNILNQVTSTVDFDLDNIPAVLTGIVYDAISGAPLVGAEISVGGVTFYSTSGGAYTCNVFPPGSLATTCGKPGYQTANQIFNYVQGNTETYNWGLYEDLNPPYSVTAALNATETQVNLNWLLPYGYYELIYDDGIPENFTIWATAGNRNAVKFTPVGYPASVSGGYVNIGTVDDYPSGSTPLVPFQIAVYDASGTGGVPGVAIDTFDVTPTNFGWVPFTFPYSISITSGSFYLVMIQGGNSPNAAGIAIDESTQQLRSYASFNNGIWVPAGGNFLMRAVIYSSGGPLLLDGMQASEPVFVEGRPSENAIYKNQPTSASGYEGKGIARAFDWASFAPTTAPDASFPAPSGIQATASELTQGCAPIPERTKPLADRAVLYDNGPLVNSPGTGPGGADESVVISPLTSFGGNFNNNQPYTIADDFFVTGGQWSVSSIDAYGYQTGSGTTSTFTEIYVRIWNGEPGTAGASVIWGDLTTNRLSSTSFTNIYRVSTPGGTQTTRPIMKITASTPGLVLNPGPYWVEFGAIGSLASGPWYPPITITGQNVTGNGVQYNLTFWQPLVSNGYAQGIPFLINGSVTPVGDLTYQVWRLKQGEETTPGVWVDLGQTSATYATDTWSLPCGPYRWGVQAIYPGNGTSDAQFSNVLGKCWTAGVTINVTPTCTATPMEGSLVQLQNNTYPDTMYVASTDTNGQVVFPNVWKGNYTLTVSRFNYDTYTQTLDITGDMTIDVALLQIKLAPTNLYVDNQTLVGIWNQPRYSAQFWQETWSSGSLTTNGWTTNPASGSNWSVVTGTGNPSPSVEFNYSPEIYNYDQYLISKTLTNSLGSPGVFVQYDIYLSNWGTTYENTMAIEVWDGISWHTMKTYTNMDGDMPWTTDAVDISPYASTTFKIRFHAAGEDSYDINNWNIDNIKLLAVDAYTGYNPCVLGYNFYLNSVLDGFVQDTTYSIPKTHVQYGQTYDACVNAVYGSGYSTQICYTFTSDFLYPPRNLTVEALECNAYLTWEIPLTGDNLDAISLPAFEGAVEHVPAILGKAPVSNPGHSSGFNNLDGPKGSLVFGVDASTDSFIDFEVDNVSGMTVIGSASTANFWHGSAFPVNEPDYAYFTDGTTNLYQVDRATGGVTNLGSMGSTSETTLDMTVDPTTGIFYMVATNSGLSADNLYTVDPSVPSFTLVGPTVNSAGMIGLACDGNGDLWGYDLVNDNFYSVDKSTGLATLVGSIGFSCNYGQNMFYDAGSQLITMAAFNAGSGQAEIRAVDVTTGSSTILSSTADQITAVSMPVSGGTTGQVPAGLIGYNVYRDEAFIAYVSGQDTTWYYDLDLDPDNYVYAVTAVYDLTEYGFPGQFDESLIEGPDTVSILCGREIPFYEPWDEALFTYNDWTFSSGQGNWVMNSGEGNPAPTADFSWLPMITDYEYALESPVLNAGPYTCASIWFDYDYKLVDRNATGDEKLAVDVFYNGTWHRKAEYANNGSVDWTSEHFDISSVQGKALKLRFVASGAKSEDILHWYVDNIHVYGICNAPVNLGGSVSLNNVTLTWEPPTCEGGGGGTLMQFIYDDGTAESGWAINPGYQSWIGNEFPLASTINGVIQSFDVWFGFDPSNSMQLTIDVFDATQTVVGTSDAFTTPAEDWATVNCSDIPFAGLFYGMVDWNNLSSSTNYLGIDTDGPNAGLDLEWYYDGSTWDKFSNMGYDGGVMLVRATALVGGDLKTVELVPGKKPVAHTNNAAALAYIKGYFDTKNYGTTGVLDGNADSSQIAGYNVYRTDVNATSPFNKLNASPVTAATYLDVIPNVLESWGVYKYYVTTVFNDSQDNEFLCESATSDTISLEFPAVGFNDPNASKLSLYPNPATEVVNVKSTSTINTIEVMNYVGQMVFTMNDVNSKTAKVNVTTMRSGVYFVKVTTLDGTRTTKITVTH